MRASLRAANPAGIGEPRPDTGRRQFLPREIMHATRATGKYHHVTALAGATDVKGHAVRRANSQLVHVCNLAGKAAVLIEQCAAQITAYGRPETLLTGEDEGQLSTWAIERPL